MNIILSENPKKGKKRSLKHFSLKLCSDEISLKHALEKRIGLLRHNIIVFLSSLYSTVRLIACSNTSAT